MMKIVSMKFAFRRPSVLLLALSISSVANVAQPAKAAAWQPALSQTTLSQTTLSQSALNQPETLEKQAAQNSKPQQPPASSESVIRAFYDLAVTGRHDLNSSLSIEVRSAGFSFSSNVRVQTIIEQPNLFRSVIQFDSFNSSQNQAYTVTSNGEQVWIFDAGQNVYSVMPYLEFTDEYDESFLIGFLANFILEMTEDVETERPSLASFEAILQDESLLAELEADLGIDTSTLGTEIIDDTQYTTLTHNEIDNDIIGTFFVSPVSDRIERMRFVGPFGPGGSTADASGEIIMEESIIHNTTPASLPPETFTFVPPADAQLSETPISIDPF